VLEPEQRERVFKAFAPRTRVQRREAPTARDRGKS